MKQELSITLSQARVYHTCILAVNGSFGMIYQGCMTKRNERKLKKQQIERKDRLGPL
jgi:hypothetical protein